MPREHAIRWGDLLSPRAMYEFTLTDAVNSLPTLLAMGGFFIVNMIYCIYLITIGYLFFIRVIFSVIIQPIYIRQHFPHKGNW